MMQQLSTISSLQNVLPYFCANQQKEQFPPSKNSYPATELFPMHAVVTEDHNVFFFGHLHNIPLPVFPAE